MTLCQKYKFETQEQKKSFVRPLGSAESLCVPKVVSYSTLQKHKMEYTGEWRNKEVENVFL